MSKPRALVVGGRGMLGRAVAARLTDGFEVASWDLPEIDITDREGTLQRIAAAAPALVINCAALVDLEGCERDPDRAWLVNAVGAGNVAAAAERCAATLFYLSSDYVFDGDTDGSYDEVATPNPLNHYGRSKLAGEELSRAACRRVCVVRSAWLFGHAAGNYVARVLQQADAEGVVRMPADQVESPTYCGHLASALLHLARCGALGVVNVTGTGACTRARFAAEVLAQAGRRERVKVVDSASAGRHARRPARSVLDCRLYRLLTGRELPRWEAGIRAYLDAVS